MKTTEETPRTEKYRNYLAAFDTHIRSSKSLKSGNYYTGNIRRFLTYLENHQVYHLSAVTPALMKQYFIHLATRPKLQKEGVLSISAVNDNIRAQHFFQTNATRQCHRAGFTRSQQN